MSPTHTHTVSIHIHWLWRPLYFYWCSLAVTLCLFSLPGSNFLLLLFIQVIIRSLTPQLLYLLQFVLVCSVLFSSLLPSRTPVPPSSSFSHRHPAEAPYRSYQSWVLLGVAACWTEVFPLLGGFLAPYRDSELLLKFYKDMMYWNLTLNCWAGVWSLSRSWGVLHTNMWFVRV